MTVVREVEMILILFYDYYSVDFLVTRSKIDRKTKSTIDDSPNGCPRGFDFTRLREIYRIRLKFVINSNKFQTAMNIFVEHSCVTMLEVT